MAVLTPARNGDECGGGWQDPGPRFGIVECVLDPLESGDEAALVQAAELAERCGSRLVLTGATRELNVWSSGRAGRPGSRQRSADRPADPARYGDRRA
jgi:hypothetical protein